MKIFIILLSVLFTSTAYSAQPQRANIDEAERYFNNAYVHFMQRNYSDAQNYLDQAINLNTYMIDYYILSALNLDRLGDTESASNALNSYIEVRPRDNSAPYIQRNFSEQNNILRSVLGTAPIPVSWRYAESNVQTEWNTGYTRPFSIKGLGKVKALGEIITIPDTFGNKLYIRQGTRNLISGSFSWAGNLYQINVPAPVIAVPLGDGSFYVFSDNGDVYSIRNFLDEPQYITTLPSAVVSDADIITQNLFAVADPADRNIAFYYTSSNGLLVRRWQPPLSTGELLFEPVAIEPFADWLAVADRANNRIYILNIINHEFFSINSIPKPRDLLWSATGDLFILSENGAIYNFLIDFGTRTFANKSSGPLYDNMINIWSLFHSPENDICWIDMGASRIFKTIMMPSREDVPGFLNIFSPSISINNNNEALIINATFISPYIHYSHNTRFIAQSVWNGKNLPSSANWLRPRNFDALFIHAPLPAGTAFPINVRPAMASRSSDIPALLNAFWLLHKDTLTNIILDASIPLSLDDTLLLLKFCALNGLELDIFARDIPSLGLVRASAFTGGKTIYSLGNTIDIPVNRTHLQILIPLPQELSSSGYPSRSMLAVYLDAGLIQSRAWLPLWPDMFTR